MFKGLAKFTLPLVMCRGHFSKKVSSSLQLAPDYLPRTHLSHHEDNPPRKLYPTTHRTDNIPEPLDLHVCLICLHCFSPSTSSSLPLPAGGCSFSMPSLTLPGTDDGLLPCILMDPLLHHYYGISLRTTNYPIYSNVSSSKF